MFKTSAALSTIWAIALKDLLAAIKNRTIVVTFLAISLGLAAYFIAPSLLGRDELPGLVVVGERTDPLVAVLLRSPSLNLTLVQSQSEMEHVLGESDDPLLGIIVPQDPATSDNSLILDGYMDHWVSEDQAVAAKRFFETQLSHSSGLMVELNVHRDEVYTQVDGKRPFNFSFPMIGLLLFVGISVGPNLFIEEKERKTLDMLLISPASINEIVIGKTCVAVLYGIITALLLVALNSYLVTQWTVALLAVCCGSVFAGLLGILLGVALNNQQQLIVWSQVILILLLLPIFLHAILQNTLVGNVLGFIPTVAIGKLVRIALSNDASVALFAADLVWLSIVIACLLLLVIWMVRRSQNAS